MVAIASKLCLVVVLLLTVGRSYGENHLEDDSLDLQTRELGNVDLDSTDDFVEDETDEDADAAEEQEDPRAWWSSSSRRRSKTGQRPATPRRRPQPGSGGGGGFWWRRKPRPKPRPRPPAPRPRPRPPGPPAPKPRPRPGLGPRPPAPSGGSCSITTYRGSNFRNSARVERGFLGGMNRINSHAGACNVQIHVTSSFRSWGASTSNHKVGHAIDMNVIDRGAWCTWGSGCLINPPARFSGVRCFIARIRGERNLRWGGDFKKVDPVHIDDGLNIYNRPLYDRILASCRRVG